MATEPSAVESPVLPAGQKHYLRCKACGLVIEEGNLGEFCPACGVKRVAFTPDTERLSNKRRALLEAHIHPIIVHIPQAFAFSALVLAIGLLFVPAPLLDHAWHSLQVIAFFLPVAGIAAFLSGLYDGKVRFKKLATPYLKQKMVLGIVFIIDTVALAWCALSRKVPLDIPGFVLIATGCLIAFICSIALGRIGASLACARMQG
ncbi:MAG: hypothetical protein JXA71_06320 [Chitinispirillaceae bacterium]|nr:hypothetical protein [Chitinispirillaceae bacterium]